MKPVNNAFGGSITNVFLAACTLSLRAWLQRHDAVPDGPLLMQVPLSLTDADSTTVDNQFTFGRIRIPVQLDAVQVLTDLHDCWLGHMVMKPPTEKIGTATARWPHRWATKGTWHGPRR